MANGDVIVLIKQITKEAGVAINQQDSFSDMPDTAEDVRVSIISRTNSGNDVIYDVMCSGVATV